MDMANTASRNTIQGEGTWPIPFPLPVKTQPIETRLLRPAKAIVELGITPSPLHLSLLAKLGDSLFDAPIRINERNEIVDGHARWLIAMKVGRQYIDCEVFSYTEEQTLREILKKHLRGPALSKFDRVQIALKLQKFHETRAKRNQAEAGHKKQLLFLTQADRAHVQKLVAQDAGVSSSLVRQVKVILQSKPSTELLAALRTETISINRGYQLSSASQSKQRNALATNSLRRSNRENCERLVAKHITKKERKDAIDGLKEIRSGLCRLPDDPLLAPLQRDIDALLTLIGRLLETNSEGAHD